MTKIGNNIKCSYVFYYKGEGKPYRELITDSENKFAKKLDDFFTFYTLRKERENSTVYLTFQNKNT
jgi:hypothetical protein